MRDPDASTTAARLRGLRRGLRTVERLPNLVGEGSGRKRFGQEKEARIRRVRGNPHLTRIPRHEDDLGRRPGSPDVVGELAAAHGRHHDVRDHEIDPARVVLTSPGGAGRVNPSLFSYVYAEDRCCAGALWTTGGRREPDAQAGEMLEMWLAVGPDRL